MWNQCAMNLISSSSFIISDVSVLGSSVVTSKKILSLSLSFFIVRQYHTVAYSFIFEKLTDIQSSARRERHCLYFKWEQFWTIDWSSSIHKIANEQNRSTHSILLIISLFLIKQFRFRLDALKWDMMLLYEWLHI